MVFNATFFYLKYMWQYLSVERLLTRECSFYTFVLKIYIYIYINYAFILLYPKILLPFLYTIEQFTGIYIILQ